MTGRVALVTGAARGIGRAIADRLRDDGLRVAAVDVRDVEPAAGIVPVRCDLADPAAVDALLARVAAEVGPVDVLVNNAGVHGPTPLDAFSRDAYRALLTIDLDAPIALMAAAASGMAERGWGRIVNVSSVHGQHGEPGSLAYDVAKAGLDQATRTAAAELAGRGVLVNAVAPGFVATEMSLVDGVTELEREPFRTVYVEHGKLPIGRACRPEEVAALVAWLAGEQNTYVTGQVVAIDGGLTTVL